MDENKVELLGFVSASKKIRTLKDLRDLVAWCDEYRVADTCEVDYGRDGNVFIDVLGSPDVVPATWIECGDHMLNDIHYDVLIETHKHPEHNESKQPAAFDWPAIDRLNELSRLE